MNIALAMLWLMVFAGTIVLIIISWMSMNAWSKVCNIIPPPGIQHCAVAFDSIPSVDKLNCCLIGETLTASRYVPSLDIVVNPIPLPYLDVCKGFCVNGAVNDTTCSGRVGQEAFEKCCKLTAPRDNCMGVAMPIAAIGITYFYANSATNDACKETTLCS